MQLNQAVVITRNTPDPVGLYVVSMGYFVAGFPDVVAGWQAMITPAFTIIPLMHVTGRVINHPRIKVMLQTVVVASAGLLLASAIPLAQAALTDSISILIARVSLALLFGTRLDTLWVTLGAATISLSARHCVY